MKVYVVLTTHPNESEVTVDSAHANETSAANRHDELCLAADEHDGPEAELDVWWVELELQGYPS